MNKMIEILKSLGRNIERAVDFLNKISIIIGITSIGLLVIVAFSGTLLRYVFHSTFVFADEVGGYLLVIMSFIGLTFAFKEGSHSVVDYAIKKVPDRIASWVKQINDLFNLAFLIILIFPFVSFVKYSFETMTRSYSILTTPLAPIQLVMPIGLGLLAIALMIDIGKRISHCSQNKRHVGSHNI